VAQITPQAPKVGVTARGASVTFWDEICNLFADPSSASLHFNFRPEWSAKPRQHWLSPMPSQPNAVIATTPESVDKLTCAHLFQSWTRSLYATWRRSYPAVVVVHTDTPRASRSPRGSGSDRLTEPQEPDTCVHAANRVVGSGIPVWGSAHSKLSRALWARRSLIPLRGSAFRGSAPCVQLAIVSVPDTPSRRTEACN
jgi:hypothetical protein